MKEIPILYSTPMIQAKLAGRKNQTRRLIGYGPPEKANRPAGFAYAECTFDLERNAAHYTWPEFPDHPGVFVKNRYGMPGDLLWARETFKRRPFYDNQFSYKADIEGKGGLVHEKYDWKPSIHMPKSAARIWDRVVSIRVERLQDITVEDCIAEGIHFDEDSGYFFAGDQVMSGDAQGCYEALWKKINREESWKANPWVWVITTENVSLTGKP